MSALSILAVLAGMAILVVGAEALVRGASRLAGAVGVPPLVVGLTVVAFGTSAPELAVSVRDALAGAGEVAVGNAVGSNIFNTLAILGIAALAGGLLVNRRIVRVDVPVLLLVTALVWWRASDGRIDVAEGVLLVLGIVAYTVGSYVLGRREPAPAASVAAPLAGALTPEAEAPGRTWPRDVGIVALGLVALVAGAQLLVGGATAIAAGLGVPELIIGLTVVAAGTSLPELATSVVAVRRGERDIAVGNVVGSNIFNLLAVLGASAIAGGGLAVPADAAATDLPVAFLVAVVALPALALGLSVARWEGVLLLVGYVGYVAYLVVRAGGGEAAGTARVALLGGFVALAAVVAIVGISIERRTAGMSRSEGGAAGGVAGDIDPASD
jgi:cation:H+ antiporter